MGAQHAFQTAPTRARIRISMPNAAGESRYGVRYIEPGASPETAVELMHDEVHEVDIMFARKLIAQKRAVPVDQIATPGPLTTESVGSRGRR